MSYAERARSTLSSLPPPAHPPDPRHERRWNQSFHHGFEEIDEGDGSGVMTVTAIAVKKAQEVLRTSVSLYLEGVTYT